jgi:hypothetical protein
MFRAKKLEKPRDFGDPGAKVEPPDGLFFKFLRELPSRQSHDSNLRLTKIES